MNRLEGNYVSHYLLLKLKDIKTIKYLIEKNQINVNARDNNGNTILHLFAENENIEMAKYLIEEKEMDVNEKNKDEDTVLHIFTKRGNIEMAKYLIEEKEMDVNEKNKDGDTILRIFAKKGNVEMAKYLIEEKGMDVNEKDKYGNTILHLYAENGDIEMAEYLIEEKGMNVNERDKYGYTILHLSAEGEHVKMARYLIEKKGMNVNEKDGDGKTILHLFAEYGNVEMAKYLIEEKRMNVNEKDGDGKTILHLSARHGRVEMAKYLIEEKEMDINEKDGDGKTVLDIVKSVLSDPLHLNEKELTQLKTYIKNQTTTQHSDLLLETGNLTMNQVSIILDSLLPRSLREKHTQIYLSEDKTAANNALKKQITNFISGEAVPQGYTGDNFNQFKTGPNLCIVMRKANDLINKGQENEQPDYNSNQIGHYVVLTLQKNTESNEISFYYSDSLSAKNTSNNKDPLPPTLKTILDNYGISNQKRFTSQIQENNNNCGYYAAFHALKMMNVDFNNKNNFDEFLKTQREILKKEFNQNQSNKPNTTLTPKNTTKISKQKTSELNIN